MTTQNFYSQRDSPLSFYQNKDECEDVQLHIQGQIPQWLSGQLVRNGSGIVKDKRTFIEHWFDGLAKLHSFTFLKGQVNYTCKFYDRWLMQN